MSLDAAAWRRLDAAVRAASALPLAERDTALQNALGDTPELLRAAREALDPDGNEPGLTRLAPNLLAHLGDERQREEDAQWQGRRIGPWHVTGRIGAGGMGTVYRVERADGAFERVAALKLLPLSLQSEELRRRFNIERRIAARLQHPGIAQLLDGGSADDGSPWLVLEYVNGEPIDAWCDRHRLDVRERVELLCAVGAIVQFAHSRLVVHRDLKPANILVDTEGRVKLLDFGIARLLEDVGEKQATGPLGVRLTPDYAAPEQFDGETISAATDVYALGCLAYRLLAGRAPLALDGQPLAAMLHTLRQETRPTLSEVAKTARLPAGMRCSDLDADLEAIARRAVACDPVLRYAAAAEFSADLRRWLDGLPVAARHAGRRYRIGRFFRRHRLGLGLTVAVFLALGGVAAVAVHQASQAREQRDGAEAMVGLLRELMQLADPNAGLGHQMGAHALLRTTLARVEADTSTQPRNRIALLDTLAEALLAFELHDEAIRAREAAHELHLTINGAMHPDTLAARRQLGLALSIHYPEQERGERLLVELLDTRRRLHGEHHLLTAESAWDLGFFYLRYVGFSDLRYQEALALLELAHQSLSESLGNEHPRTGQVLFDLGLATADRHLKIARLRQAIAIRQAALGPDDPALLLHQGDLAMVLSASGEAEEGIALARSAAEGHEAIRGELHPLTLRLWNNLAGLYRDHGQFDKALAVYTRVDERVRLTSSEGHIRRAYPRYGLGLTLNRLGRPEEAEPHLRAALELVQANGRESMIAVTRGELGDSLAAQGRIEAAQREYRAALVLYTEALGRDDDDPNVRALQLRLLNVP